jgi:hypothetical protein
VRARQRDAGRRTRRPSTRPPRSPRPRGRTARSTTGGPRSGGLRTALHHLGAVDVAARELGWSDDDGRLRTALGYYETSRREGTPIDAEFVPAITYSVPPPAAGTTGCGSPGYLRETSVERSSAPWAKEFTERAVLNPAFERSSGPRPRQQRPDCCAPTGSF